MSASPSENFLSPTTTSSRSPYPLLTQKRERRHPIASQSGSSNLARQVADQDEVGTAEVRCEDTGNYVISCFPSNDTIIPQHEWASFVWNSRRPEITQTNLVDIYLFHADSLAQILYFPNQINPFGQAGVITAQVNDSWWGDRGGDWAGQNISYPYFWVIIRSDATLDGSQIPQATFTAVQTTYADSVSASMASTSAAASSLAALSASLHRPSSTDVGTIQSNSSGESFPHWAVALIVVLGFLAVVASCALAFLLLCRVGWRRASSSNRNSMGSASPMMADIGNSPQSPLLATGAITAQQASAGQRAPSVVSPDGASTISRANSADAGPFSGADAAIMADAFRKALRKPDFAGQPVEEDVPDSQRREEELLKRELSGEGRGIRNVQSSRGVKVETLSDNGDPP